MTEASRMPRPVLPPGQTGVDYEMRVNYDRTRDYRLSRAQAALEASECGAFLLFDFYNIRYATQSWVGTALGDKMIRYARLARGGEPHLWDFGSAVKHYQMYPPWPKCNHNHPGFLGFRGAVTPSAGLVTRSSSTSSIPSMDTAPAATALSASACRPRRTQPGP